ncbi:hypothetical protein HanRHA438_Chr17g0835831 [Helianthus annuus]|uniref:Uncharacterized protein n=1 Tax=Helianthus annuus TaxID=4232 RepID=A0A9K3GWB2_HELAN|nr:hypothetical protein HanXRQr2_Chr17g0825581 [Helianthus annuus]KAJ0828317.1 hypothetical protein HanRHA438_Chr17g0835831 [Helianthus annuus]
MRKVTKGNVTIKSCGSWRATMILKCVREILLCSFCYHVKYFHENTFMKKIYL